MAKKKRRSWSATEKAQILREFHDSGLSKEAFGRRKRIYPSTLGNWLSKQQEAARKAPAVVPVDVRPAAGPESPSSLEVVLRGGQVVRVTAGFDPQLLVQVVATLQRC